MKVKPIMVIKVPMHDVEIGEVFSYNGKKYMKIDFGEEYDGVTVITLNPIAHIQVNNQTTSIEQRAFAEYIKFRKAQKNSDIIDFELPNTDFCKEYASILKQHFDDSWYVDNGDDDNLYKDEFFYMNRFSELQKGKPDTQIPFENIDKLGVRVVCFFEPYTEVFVHAN